MSSRLYIYSLLLSLIVLASTSLITNAAAIEVLKDNNLVAKDTLLLVRINMSDALDVSTTPTYVVLNVTIPAGFELLYVNVTYNTSVAEPDEIKWDPDTRNLTIKVGVMSAVTYNDLNVTLALVPRLDKEQSGELKATYYYNIFADYYVLSEATVTLTVNGTALACSDTNYNYYSYESYYVVIAGSYGLKAINTFLNNIQLSWINETAIDGKVVKVVINETNSLPSVPVGEVIPGVGPIELSSFSSIMETRFGSTTASAQVIGIDFIGCPGDGNLLVVTVTGPVPVTGNITFAGFTNVFLYNAEINSTYIAIDSSDVAGETYLNFSKLLAIHASMLYKSVTLNATANAAEAHLAGVLVSNTATITATTAPDVTSALLYIIASKVPSGASMTLSDAWSGEAILSAIDASVTGSLTCIGCDLVPYLEQPYNEDVYALPLTYEVSILATTFSVVEALNVRLDVTSLAQSSTVPQILKRVLLNTDRIEDVVVVARVPSKYATDYDYTISLSAPSIVVIAEPDRAYYDASGTTSYTVALIGDDTIKVVIAGAMSPIDVAVKGAGYGNETILLEVTIPLPVLVLNGETYNITIDMPSGFKPVAYLFMLNPNVKAKFESLDPYTPEIQNARAWFNGVRLNITLNMSMLVDLGPPTFSDPKFYLAVKAPNSTGTYSFTVNFYDNMTGYKLAKTGEASYTITTPDTLDLVYFSDTNAFRLYISVLNGLAAAYNAPRYIYVNLVTALKLPPLPGRLGILSNMTNADVPVGYYMTDLAITSDNMLCLIGVNGFHKAEFDKFEIRRGLDKVCLKNIELSAMQFAVNTTTFNPYAIVDQVIIENSVISGTSVGINASTIIIKDSVIRLGSEMNISAEYNSSIINTTIDTTILKVRKGIHYVLYSRIKVWDALDVSGGKLVVILPLEYTDNVSPYIKELLPNVNLLATAYTIVSGTAATATANHVSASVEYTTPPPVPTIVAVAEIQPATLPPGPGFKKVADVAIIGLTPAKVSISFVLWPLCTSLPANTILTKTKVYFYNTTSNNWNITRPAAMTLDTTTCTLTLVFDSTSPIKPANFTGLTIAINAPTTITVVGISTFETYKPPVPEAVLTAQIAAALIALGVTLAALAARRQ